MFGERAGLRMGFASALLAFAGALAGCGETPPGQETTDTSGDLIASVCEQQCACKGCSDSGKTDCLRGGQESKAHADAAGCTELWFEFAECMDVHPVCDAGTVVLGQCSSVAVETDKCIAAGMPDTQKCDDLRAQIGGSWEECGVSAPSEPAGCTDATLAFLQCEQQCLTSFADCAIIDGTNADGKEQLDGCLSTCPAP